MNSISAVFLWLLSSVFAQDPNCDFHQDVKTGNTYYVYSPNYPNNYSGGVKCRWIANCPTGYNCRLDCPEINIPQSQSCSMDRLLVSRSGDPQLTGAEKYCGRGTLNVVSTGQSITMGEDKHTIGIIPRRRSTGSSVGLLITGQWGRFPQGTNNYLMNTPRGLITAVNSTGGRFRCRLIAQPVTPSNKCSCGERRQNRIVGGEETGVNEYRMMVGVVDARIGAVKCGAVIISNKHVLTAAHCVLNAAVSDFAVIVGEHDITTGTDTPAARGYRISSFTIHPQYTEANYDNDIAIVTVQGVIEFNERVGPVCLPFKFANNSFAGSKVTLLGWGTLFTGGPTSNVLRKVDVDVISQNSCRSKMSTLTDRQMCTYTPQKDACQDDSGGPVLFTDPATGLLFGVGVISYGRFCAGMDPGINTRVTSFLNWILINAPSTYCVK